MELWGTSMKTKLSLYFRAQWHAAGNKVYGHNVVVLLPEGGRGEGEVGAAGDIA